MSRPPHLQGSQDPARGLAGDVAELVEDSAAALEPIRAAANRALSDDSWLVRWVGPLFLFFAVVLAGWVVLLALRLPGRVLTTHYDLAWTGFDVAEMVLLAATAVAALHRSRWLAVRATCLGTLLVVDAWFDVVTTPGRGVYLSIVLAALVELPLAGCCFWLAHHATALAEQRIVLLLRQRRRGP